MLSNYWYISLCLERILSRIRDNRFLSRLVLKPEFSGRTEYHVYWCLGDPPAAMVLNIQNDLYLLFMRQMFQVPAHLQYCEMRENQFHVPSNKISKSWVNNDYTDDPKSPFGYEFNLIPVPEGYPWLLITKLFSRHVNNLWVHLNLILINNSRTTKNRVINSAISNENIIWRIIQIYQQLLNQKAWPWWLVSSRTSVRLSCTWSAPYVGR